MKIIKLIRRYGEKIHQEFMDNEMARLDYETEMQDKIGNRYCASCTAGGLMCEYMKCKCGCHE